MVDLSGSPDLEMLSKAYGIRFMRLKNMKKMNETLDAFLENDDSVILECIIDPMDLV